MVPADGEAPPAGEPPAGVAPAGELPVLTTIGHGTLGVDELGGLLARERLVHVVDVRSFPGSRRHPHFGRAQLEQWLPAAGIAYSWEPRLGGRRQGVAGSAHPALRHDAFRAYADHMDTDEFRAGLDDLVARSAGGAVVVMCAESLWWRCHRRLLADALVARRGVAVEHLFHDGHRARHAVTPEARRVGDRLVYDVGATPSLW